MSGRDRPEYAGDEIQREFAPSAWLPLQPEPACQAPPIPLDWICRLAPDRHIQSASSQSSDAPLTDNPDLEVVLDIPVKIAMEVGSTQITIRNLLQLNQGSVIELERLAGEPLDVLVNGTLIAHGEVVVVNEKFGIRVTDVISPSERIKKLK